MSHADKTWVRKTLLPRLEKAGRKVCIDCRDFTAGKPALINMNDAVKNGRHTLLIMMEAWTQREWTLYEMIFVRTKDPAGLQRRTIPVRMEECELPEFISMLTWVDFTDPDLGDLPWTQLLTAVGAAPEAALVPIQSADDHAAVPAGAGNARRHAAARLPGVGVDLTRPRRRRDCFRARGIRGARAEIQAVCAPVGYHPLSLALLAGLVADDPAQPGDIAAVRKYEAAVAADLKQR